MLIGHKCSIIILPSIVPASLSASILVPNTGDSKIKYQSFKSSRLHLEGVYMELSHFGYPRASPFCQDFVYAVISCSFSSCVYTRAEPACQAEISLTQLPHLPGLALKASYMWQNLFSSGFSNISTIHKFCLFMCSSYTNNETSCLTRIDKLCNFSYKHNKNHRYCFDIYFINGVLNTFNFTRGSVTES